MKEQEKWSPMLIDDIVGKIREQKIVPVIGPEMYYVEGYDSVQDYIIDCVLNNKQCTINGTQYVYDQELVCSPSLRRNSYRGMTTLDKIVQTDSNANTRLLLFNLYNNSKDVIKLKENVRNFLEYGDFPLILTTCNFNYLTEQIKYKGSRYKDKSYKKRQGHDIDVNNENLIISPTIFYLFGTIGSDNNGAAITENDFLGWMHCLQDSEFYPKKLKNYLEDKYILSLGCEIPDWTFRLLLYSLKEKDGYLSGSKGKDSFDGGLVSRGLDDDLSCFLSDISYFSHTQTDDFLVDVNTKLAPEDRPKLFLSLCSEEYNTIGNTIKQKISDKFEVLLYPDIASSQYWGKIEEAIESCDYFVPVITDKAQVRLSRVKKIPNDIRDAKDSEKTSGLIVEWLLASDNKRKKRGREKFCIPYFLNTNWKDFRDTIEEKDQDKTLLWSLFFPEEGAEAFFVPLEQLTGEELEAHINRGTHR